MDGGWWRAGALVSRGLLPAQPSELHDGPPAPRGLLLRSGGVVDVCLSRAAPAGRPTCGHARHVRGTWRQVDGSHRNATRRQHALLERADTPTSQHPQREHHEVGLAGVHRHQQLSARHPQGTTALRRHTLRCSLLGRGHVPQGRGHHPRVESEER